MNQNKIYKFEANKSRDYWIEIREITNSFSEYEHRNSLSINGKWETMTFYPGENFISLLNAYRDYNSLYTEVIAPNDIRYPSFNELLLGATVDSPHKCKCEIGDLMSRGCQCRGV